jgi:GNAT superfamily N-acetyltransferase
MKDFKIRMVNEKDLKNIRKIFKSWKPEDWDWEYAHGYFEKFFRNTRYSQDQIFVGEKDNRIVSVIGYRPDRLYGIGLYWLGWFYTHKDSSHHGVGKFMFDFVISELKTQKAEKLFIDTSSNPFYKSALDFYQKIGFNKIKVVNDFYEKNEHKIILSKRI